MALSKARFGTFPVAAQRVCHTLQSMADTLEIELALERIFSGHTSRSALNLMPFGSVLEPRHFARREASQGLILVTRILAKYAEADVERRTVICSTSELVTTVVILSGCVALQVCKLVDTS